MASRPGRTAGAASLLLLLCTTCAPQEPLRREDDSAFLRRPDEIELNTQLARFRGAGDEVVLHVHISFQRSRLLFMREETPGGARWRAEYEWRVVARDRSSRQVGGGVYSREVILAEDEWPDDLTALVSDFQAVPIPRGQHRIEVTVDDRNSIRRGQGEFLVEAFDTRYGEPGLGQIELLRPESAVPGESPAPAFWPPEHAGEVLASGRNPEQADCLGFLYETYRLPAESRVVYRLLNERGRAVRSRERPSPAGEAVVVRDTLGTVGLREGRYELEVNVEGVGARGFTQRRGVIVRRPLLAWGEEMEETVSQLRLYASVDQVEAFRGLEADRRRAFLAQIWLEMDPTPGTARNEYREEFERRLRYADERWASGGRRGWDSEIGRVYVAYGEPDEVREGRTVLPAQGPLDDPREARVQIWIYRDPPVSYTFIYEPDRGWMLSRDSSSPIPPTPGAPADQIHAKGRS